MATRDVPSYDGPAGAMDFEERCKQIVLFTGPARLFERGGKGMEPSLREDEDGLGGRVGETFLQALLDLDGTNSAAMAFHMSTLPYTSTPCLSWVSSSEDHGLASARRDIWRWHEGGG